MWRRDAFHCCIFFFQAEDGIRDTSVTGVQTCALPISGGGTNPNMDIISSTPYPDFINNVVWVTSRGAGGTTQPSVWKLNATNGTLASGTATWNLGDVDSSPVPNADGSFIYVGTNAGTLQAIKVSTGGVSPYTPVNGTGVYVLKQPVITLISRSVPTS